MSKIFIDEALAQPPQQNCKDGSCDCCWKEPAQQEPVAWMTKDGEIYKSACWPEHEARPLVFGDTPQAKRTWVGLTDEEIESIFNNWPTYHLDHEDFARVIEAKLKEKNT
jgi:hypothetical protein